MGRPFHKRFPAIEFERRRGKVTAGTRGHIGLYELKSMRDIKMLISFCIARF